MEVVDNFNLADSVFDTFINGENIVVQLKEKKSNGALKLRYLS